MNPVSMSSDSSYTSRIISAAKQKQGNVLIQLLEGVRMAQVAQAKPLANLRNIVRVDVYA